MTTRLSTNTRTTVATVVVADDRAVVRAGLRAAFAEPSPGDEVTLEMHEGNLAEAGELVEANHPDALVVVLRGDDPEPYRAIATAKALSESIHVLALVDDVTAPDLREAVIAGADGFLVTSAPLAEIHHAITATVHGERVVSPEVAMHLVGTWRPDGEQESRAAVTARELEVLEHLAEGKTNREIADSLDVSPRTVKTHVQNLLSKLDVPDRTGAVARAFRLGLIR